MPLNQAQDHPGCASTSPAGRRAVRWDRTLLSLIPLATLSFFLWGAGKQSARNTDLDRTDQRAYITCARESRVKPFGFLTTRNYMPVFPQIMEAFYREGMSDEEFLEVGKRVNTVFALLAAILLYGVLLWRNHPWDAVIAASAGALSMLAFKAAAFQPEVLFLTFALLMFIAQLRLIMTPSAGRAIVAGALTGLAYLTKASVPPLALLTVVCLAGRWVESRFFRKNARRGASEPTATEQRWVKHPMLAAGLFLVTSLIVVSPYLRGNKVLYGRWYCENNSYFMWCDSWQECEDLMNRVGWEKGLYSLPASELPGPMTYWRTHSIQDAMVRVGRGFKTLYDAHVPWGYGYARFVMAYGLCLGMAAFGRRKVIREWLSRDGNKWAALYGVGFFAGYLLLCAWYTYIDSSRRFALILFLPAMYLFVRGQKVIRDSGVEWRLFGVSMRAEAVSAIILLVLTEYVFFDFVYRIQVMDGTY